MTEIRLAPLAGITDWVFRTLCFEQGCDCATTEMVSALGYVYAKKINAATENLLRRGPEEKKLILQLFGKEETYISRAAAELSASGRYEGIDINMGCPAHKVAASGEGSGLMRTPILAEKIMRGAVKASVLPVSVKMRLGWDDQSINVVELAKAAEAAGICEITVHGRTKVQMYSGKADWDMIARVKQAVQIPVLGNGDIDNADDAINKIQNSGVDGIVIGRGALGNPWIFAEIKNRLHGKTWNPPTVQERISLAIRHYDLQLSWKPKKVAVGEMRKHIGWYIHGIRGAAQLRDLVNRIEDPDGVKKLLLHIAEESI